MLLDRFTNRFTAWRWMILPAGLALVTAAGCGSNSSSTHPGGRFGGAGGIGAGGSATGGSGGMGAAGSGGSSIDGGAGAGGAAAGAAGMGGSAGAGGQGGSAGSCNDPDEPDDTPATANQACTNPTPCSVSDTDSDGSSTRGPIQGVLTDGDVDWWTFTGTDHYFAVAQADASTTDKGYRLCVFVSCLSGTTTVSSCTQGILASGPQGLQGCCSNNGEASPYHSCSGSDDSAQVYIRLDGATACQAYTVNWHF